MTEDELLVGWVDGSSSSASSARLHSWSRQYQVLAETDGEARGWILDFRNLEG